MTCQEELEDERAFSQFIVDHFDVVELMRYGKSTEVVIEYETIEELRKEYRRFKTMNNGTSAEIICSKCGKYIVPPSDQTSYELCECFKFETQDMTRLLGWICPKCGASNSPSSPTCSFCTPSQSLKITC